jgi:hypothetical protein
MLIRFTVIFGILFFAPIVSFASDDNLSFISRDQIINASLDRYDLAYKEPSSFPSEPTKTFPSSQDETSQDMIQDEEEPYSPPAHLLNLKPARKLPGNTFEMGGEVSHIRYEEPSVNVKDEGEMYGVFASYTHRFSNAFQAENPDRDLMNMMRIDGKFSTGLVDYEGSGTINDIRDYMFETRGVLGLDMNVAAYDARMTPYAGLGYRYLYDDTSDRVSSTGASGYRRKANYFYAPVGVEIEKHFNDNWSVELTTEYDFFLTGRQYSYLSDAVPGLNDIRNKQKKGWGARAGFKIIRSFEAVDFFVEPFFRYWKIEDSDFVRETFNGVPTGFVVYEPKNTSTEYGLKIGAKF